MSDVSTFYFYRYKILSEDDLKRDVFGRRLQKAKQNTTTDILFDLTEFKQTLTDFNILTQHSFGTCFLVRPDQLSDVKHFKQILQISSAKDIDFLKNTGFKIDSSLTLLLAPLTTTDLNALLDFTKECPGMIYWDFKPYNPRLKKSLTLKNIFSAGHSFQRLPGLEVWNTNIPSSYELEAISEPLWQMKTPKRNILISFMIPSFNNLTFLTNVVHHLTRQKLSPENYEIIIVEDGGFDQTPTILYELLHIFKNKINLKMIYWSKEHPLKGKQNFFRAGLARNLATQYAESDFLFFLDSDMLTPPEFADLCLKNLEKYDVIQFERHHINQKLSLTNPQIQNVRLTTDTYIEESDYWSKLFKATDWMQLQNHWKYTCTYALGMKKKDFLKCGRFKKYYVSYGFEDTDLGYELFLKGKKSHLVQTPLLHLTAYDQMQYKNSKLKRLQLLRKTAALFYLQHLNPDIYKDFGNFYQFEKPLINTIKDLF